MRALVERALDQPFLSDRNTDDWANTRGRDGIVELSNNPVSHCRPPLSERGKTGGGGGTNLVVVRVIDQAVLAVNQDPVESARMDDRLGQWCRGVPTWISRVFGARGIGNIREPEPESGLAGCQLRLERSLHLWCCGCD